MFDSGLADLMQALADRRGWPPCQPEGGRYALVVDLGLEVTLFQVGHELFIEGRVSDLPMRGAERDETLRRLLRLQLARLRDFDEALTIAEEATEGGEAPELQLLLYRRLGLGGLGLADFEQALGRFVAALDVWNRAAASAPKAPSPFLPGAGMVFP